MTAVPLLSGSAEAHAALARARALYTDLDGTLLGPGGSLLVDGDGAPASTAAEAVVAVNRAGLDVRITSGRNRRQLAEVSRVCGWSGFIGELGCVIVHERGERPVYFTGDWPEGAVEPGDTPYLMIERAGALRVLSDLFPGRIEQHDPWHVDREATHVLRGNVDVEAGRAALAALELPVDLIDNGIIHPPRHTLVDVAEVHAYHLVPAGATKEGAVVRDLEHRGLAARDAIAIGDSATDVAMAEAVALMVLVGNALDDTRALEAAAGRTNVVRVTGRRGDGWAELA
ncbi:MAG: hypothetical protein C0418_06510, partial [Coriobacteriaceae bacterium]|nr:hypothetical protein [Coriobacteriaceae bacterium]